MITVEFHAIEFATAGEALQHVEAVGCGSAILCDGKHLIVEESVADRLEAAGVEFAYLFDRQRPDGSFRITTVPVND